MKCKQWALLSLFAELSQVYSSVTMTRASTGSVRASYECFSLVRAWVSSLVFVPRPWFHNPPLARAYWRPGAQLLAVVQVRPDPSSAQKPFGEFCLIFPVQPLHLHLHILL